MPYLKKPPHDEKHHKILLDIERNSMKRLFFFAGFLVNFFLNTSLWAIETQSCPTADRTEISLSTEASSQNLDKKGIITGMVQTQNPKAVDAASQNAEIMQAIYKKWDSLKQDKKDIHTLSYQLIPLTRYDEKTTRSLPDGFSVQHQLSFDITDTKMLGKIADHLLGAGLTQIQNISTTYEETPEIKQTLRLEALSNAQRQAETIMKHFGGSALRLKSVQNIAYDGANPAPMPMLAMARADKSSAETSLQLETNPYKITVQTLWHYCP